MQDNNMPSNDTKDFSAVSNNEGSNNGATRQFDALPQADEKTTAEGEAKKENKTKSEKATKTARAAKVTLSGVLFALRKVLTYTLNVVLTLLLVGVITGCAVALAFFIYIRNYVDPSYDGLDNLKFDSAQSTTMYYVDANGNEILLEEDTLKSSENRLWAEYEDIPQMLIDAYIAVEDQRFMSHNGVDTTRTASAIYNFFIPTSSNYGGGSTITQQLIKNVSGDNETTIQRKVQEIFRAFDVESKYTKAEIMEMYLNTIYLSHNSYGVRVAAQTYFGKDLDQLTLVECAAIASIGKWPINYDPIVNPQNNLERRNLVLKLMLEQEKITEEEFNAAYDAPLKLADGTEEEYTETIHSYYIDAVMDDVVADLMEEYGYDKTTASNMLYSGGLQIVTCMDPVIQECAEKVYTDKSYWPETKGMQAQSAICIMDPSSGDLLAIVGGLGEKKESRGFNRATHAYRQCGSSIKPVSIYALALESGLYHGGSSVDDIPQGYDKETGEHWPSNAGRGYLGKVSLDYAIQASLNTIAVSTFNQLGTDRVFDNFQSYGYTTLVESKTLDNGMVVSDKGASPLALGGLTYGVTVREHTQAYATLANEGRTSEARTYSVVRDSRGVIVLDNRESHEVKYSESTAAVMTDLLTHVVNGRRGTARNDITIDDTFEMQVAGKTGTTNDNRDVYFCGYTPELLASVWYGYDNNKTVSDSHAAAKLWDAVFNEIYTYYKDHGITFDKEFTYPSSVKTNVEYCTVSGKIPTEACRRDLFHLKYDGTSCIATGTFAINDVPTEECDSHIMVNWDERTKGICVDGCACPEGNLIQVGLRKMNLSDRNIDGKAYVDDAQFVYIDVPVGYNYPTDPTVPFFQNLLDEETQYRFGVSVSTSRKEHPANKVCTEHYNLQPVLPPNENGVIPG